MKYLNARLSLKIITIMMAVLTLSFGALGYALVRRQQNSMMNRLMSQAQSAANMVSYSSLDPILSSDYPTIETILTEYSRAEAEVKAIRVLKGSNIIASYGNDAPEKLADVVYVSAPIQARGATNEAAYSVGEVRLWLSTEAMKESIRATIISLISGIVASYVVVSLLLFFALSRLVLVPIRLLKEHAETIGNGHLDSRLDLGRDDELGNLGNTLNQMAVSLKSMAQLELDQKVMEKDLELTGLVQSFFLPRSSEYKSDSLTLNSCYMPAATSGGDWWWHEVLADGRLILIVGDVTGHGAGSAMIAAAIASSHSTVRLMQQSEETDPAYLVDLLHKNLRQISEGKYMMTFSVIEVDSAKETVRWWNAGSPPVAITRASGKLEIFVGQSSPLGAGRFSVFTGQSEFKLGDRLHAFTDGLYEFVLPDGDMLRMKGLMTMFRECKELSLDDAKGAITQRLASLKNDGAKFDDDITLVMIDFARTDAVSKGK